MWSPPGSGHIASTSLVEVADLTTGSRCWVRYAQRRRSAIRFALLNLAIIGACAGVIRCCPFALQAGWQPQQSN